MPDITDHPQYDAVAMMVEKRMFEVAERLGCEAEIVNAHETDRTRAIAAFDEIVASILRAYDRAHSTDRAAS